MKKRGRHSRRGDWVVVVLIGGAAIAASLGAVFGFLVPASTVAGIFAAAAAIAALYPVVWNADAGDRQADDSLITAKVAGQFVVAVGNQWRSEAVKRRLDDPYPLDVRWIAATVSWGADWDSLRQLAREGTRRTVPRRPGWATGPEALAGGGRELPRIIDRVPTGRLLVLGAPGSGKTMLMVRLVLDLLENREDSDPVPVLASLASWNPVREDLQEWLTNVLASEYPALASPAPSGYGDTTQAGMLVASGLVLPILDGLDEIPRPCLNLAIQHINTWTACRQLVVTCRTGDDGDGSGPPLQAAAVKLCPLEPKTVARYLAHGTPGSPSRWRSVIDVLGTPAPAGIALTTPLMVAMARSAYTPRPDETGALDDTRGLPAPAELVSPELNTRKAVEQRLFDQFIATAYYYDPDPRWPAEKAEPWLVFLASHMAHTIGSPDFAWWQLWKATPAFIFGIAAGLWTAIATGIAAGLGHGVGRGIAAGLVVGFAAAPFGGLAGGLAIGLAVARWRQASSPRGAGRRLQVRGLAAGLAVGLAAMTAVGIAFGLASGLSHGLLAGLRAGVVPGLGSGLALGLAVGLAAAWWPLPQPSPGMRRPVRPRRKLARRIHIRTSTFAAGLVTGAGAGLTVGLPYGLEYGILAGLATGLAVSLAYGMQRRPPLTAAATPHRALVRERHAAILIALPAVAGVGLIFGVGFPPAFAPIVGLASGLAVGNIISILKTAWPAYRISHAWLILRGKLPRQLMDFLEDAHERGVLHQEGTLYQFRHHDLWERLADRAQKPTSGPP